MLTPLSLGKIPCVISVHISQPLPYQSLSCLGIASTTLCKGKRDSPLALHLPFDEDRLASEEIKEVLLLTTKLILQLCMQPLSLIHSALDVLPE